MTDIKYIKKILENHQHWIKKDVEGWEKMRANLRDADLCGADLCGADLCGANLRDADLRDADLCGANLRDADLCGADLRSANLYGANLRDADLCGADLRSANLYGANLRDADLCGANLRDADLCGANLRSANLCGADLYCAKNANVPITCPDTGSFIGWKKCRNDTIVKLEIPEDAQRLSAAGRKCRCNKAIVLSIENLDGTDSEYTKVSSRRDIDFVYEIGKMVEVKDFCLDRWKECSTGIHFFITRQEAVDYDI